MVTQTGSWEALAVLVSATLFAAAGAGWTCLVRSWCLQDGTCVAMNGSALFPTFQCSFANKVPLMSDLLFQDTASMSSNLAGLTRGMCGVGERLTLSELTGRSTCMLLRPYHDALDQEVMEPSASTDHERACGAWLNGGVALQPSLVQTVEYLAFDDTAERAAAVRSAEAAQYAGSRLSGTNPGKLRTACQRAVLGGSGALRAAGQLAYEYLVEVAAIEGVADETTALKSLGVLVGHYCDAPILFGWNLKVNGLRTSVRRGRSFDPYAMASALKIVGASTTLQAQAEVSNKHVNGYADSSPEATTEQIKQVLRAATQRPAEDDHIAGGFDLDLYQAELDGYVHLLVNGALADAKAYLHGLAAMCAFSLESLVPAPGDAATPDASPASRWRTRMQRELPAAASLGALKAPPNHSPLFEVASEDILNASTVTLSQLVAGEAGEACLELTRMLFPDETDELHHQIVISPRLYDRMDWMVKVARAGVTHVLRNDATIRGALTDPDAVALLIDNVRMRIPGAPRGSWGGATRPIPVASFDSADGVFVMAAKQARSLFLDRQGTLVYDGDHACEAHSPYTALTANAFIWPAMSCSFYLLGMSARPFADGAYDDASLASRAGYIFAHEFSHAVLGFKDPYNLTTIDGLLSDFPCSSSSTRDEAFADILGVLGILQTGLVNSSELCLHVSQSWVSTHAHIHRSSFHAPPACSRIECV